MMRTADECLAKAADLERSAERCASVSAKADYRDMARRWRDVATQATWQDARLDWDIASV